jgi:hypothetical protein
VLASVDLLPLARGQIPGARSSQPTAFRFADAAAAERRYPGRASMKNVQVIDGAQNCTYDVFAASDEDHALLFPNGTDIAFAEDLESRADIDQVERALERLWPNRVPKAQAMGIHGTLFYQLTEKRAYYPSRKDEEATNPDGQDSDASARCVVGVAERRIAANQSGMRIAVEERVSLRCRSPFRAPPKTPVQQAAALCRDLKNRCALARGGILRARSSLTRHLLVC